MANMKLSEYNWDYLQQYDTKYSSYCLLGNCVAVCNNAYIWVGLVVHCTVQTITLKDVFLVPKEELKHFETCHILNSVSMEDFSNNVCEFSQNCSEFSSSHTFNIEMNSMNSTNITVKTLMKMWNVKRSKGKMCHKFLESINRENKRDITVPNCNSSIDVFLINNERKTTQNNPVTKKYFYLSFVTLNKVEDSDIHIIKNAYRDLMVCGEGSDNTSTHREILLKLYMRKFIGTSCNRSLEKKDLFNNMPAMYNDRAKGSNIDIVTYLSHFVKVQLTSKEVLAMAYDELTDVMKTEEDFKNYKNDITQNAIDQQIVDFRYRLTLKRQKLLKLLRIFGAIFNIVALIYIIIQCAYYLTTNRIIISEIFTYFIIFIVYCVALFIHGTGSLLLYYYIKHRYDSKFITYVRNIFGIITVGILVLFIFITVHSIYFIMNDYDFVSSNTIEQLFENAAAKDPQSLCSYYTTNSCSGWDTPCGVNQTGALCPAVCSSPGGNVYGQWCSAVFTRSIELRLLVLFILSFISEVFIFLETYHHIKIGFWQQ